MHLTLILTPLIFKATGSLRPISLLSAVLLIVVALYASKKGGRRVATALFAGVVAIVILSVFWVVPRPFDAQPSPDAQETADATRQLVNGNGYVTYVQGGQRHPPRYPPGFSLALAPFAAVSDDYPWNVQRGATFYAALYVLIAAAAAWSLKGPTAGALAAVLLGMSPFAKVEASLIMSDGFAAGMTVLFIPLLQHPTPKRISLAGALAGALVAVRLPMFVNLIALLIVLPWALRKRLLLFSALPLAALGLFNWLTFGGPLRTGYDYWLPRVKSFSPSYAINRPIQGDGPWLLGDALGGLLLHWVCPCPDGGPQAALSNLFFYPAVLVGVFWIFVPPLIPVVGILYCWQHRRALTVRFTFWLSALSLVLFTFYFYQGARFMAAPATVLSVFAAAQLAGWIERGARIPSATWNTGMQRTRREHVSHER
jgi:hypothetical protein